jgi:uncharacterized protein DUF11
MQVAFMSEIYTNPNRRSLTIGLIVFSLFLSFTPISFSLRGNTLSYPKTPIPLQTTQDETALPSYPIQYTSFAGVTYQLNAYDGRHCRYALPNSWTQPGALTTPQLRRLIDLTDLTYSLLTEITAGEPQGSGPLTIAVIPTGTLAGHAGTNFKGIELSENELPSVIQHVNSDLLTPESIHELSHNFEIHTQLVNLGYTDSSHAWTSFLVPFFQYYSRAGILQSDADALLQKKLTEYTLAWDLTGATWTQCVRNGNSCPNVQANNAWAGLLLRFTRLHGIEALKRTFRYLRDYAATHPATGPNPTVPQTREEKNDLLVEALADGAQQNILCEIDAWHWFATTEARNRISLKFPTPNPFCVDSDADGFSPLNNDTDDTNPQIKPTAIEAINNIDDDCNGIIDDLLLTEQTDFPSTPQSAATIPIPSKVRGQATPLDVDTVIINFTGLLPRRLRLNLQSPNTFVGFIQLQPVDLKGRTQSFSVAGGGSQILSIPRAGLWALSIQNSTSTTSDYSLTIEDAGTPTSPVRLKVLPGPNNTFQISATMDTTRTYTPPVNTLRFWLGPSSFVHTTAFQPQVSFALPIPTGTGPFSLRAQLMNNETPVTKTTLPLWIRRTTGEMLDQTSDLSITADTILPTETQTGNNSTFGFTVINLGPGLAQTVEVNIPIPTGLNPVSTSTTLGNAQLTNNSFRLTISQLAAEETVSFSILTTNQTAQGTLTTTATISSSTADPDQSNNKASITGNFSASPTPTPTIDLLSLPTKSATASTRSVLSQASLARVIVQLPDTSFIDSYGQQNTTGAWPTTLTGFQIHVGQSLASMIAVKQVPNSNPTTYTLDFIVPDLTPIDTQVSITITQQTPSTTWNTTATITNSAPAFWASDGTANGPLLALDADLLTTFSSNTPFTPDNNRRILLFASGAKRLIEQGTLSIQVNCQSGYQGVLVHDFATTLPSFPLQQITIRIPPQLTGCGKAQLTIRDSADNQAFLLIQ